MLKECCHWTQPRDQFNSVSIFTTCSFKILPSILGPPKWIFPPTCQTKILYESLSPVHLTYFVCLILLNNHHPIWWKIHIMKLIIIQVFLYSYCSLFFRTKYSPLDSLLKHLQFFRVGLCKTRKIIAQYILSFRLLDRRQDSQSFWIWKTARISCIKFIFNLFLNVILIFYWCF
jgi:hypothetical protein